MHLGIRRCVYVAFVVVGLLLVRTTSAQAQSDESTGIGSALTAQVSSDAIVAPALASKFTAPSFRPKLQANFLAAAREAQLGPSDDDSGIGVGVLGMITRTSFRGDDFFDLENRTGWGAGLWVGGNRNGLVGFTGEFIYLKRGNDEGLETTAFQIPAVFHINFGSRSRDSVGGYVVVGPSFTLILDQKLFGEDVEDDQFRGADIGIIGGVGVEFFRIGIEARGNWGLRSISSQGDVGDTKTFTFELLGKFAFN